MGENTMATQSFWEWLTKANPDRNLVSMQDKRPYNQILIQSNAHRVNYSPSGKIKAIKVLKYTRVISQLLSNTKELPWESLQQ